jgi:hypothetical protein
MGGANSIEAKEVMARLDQQNTESRNCRLALETQRAAIEKQTAEVHAWRTATEKQTRESEECRATLTTWQTDIDGLVRQARDKLTMAGKDLDATRAALVNGRATNDKLATDAREQVKAARAILDRLEEQYLRVPKPPTEMFNINGHLIPRDDIATAKFLNNGYGWYSVVVVLKNCKEHTITQSNVTEANAVAWIGKIHALMESPRKYPLPQFVASPIFAPSPAAAAAPPHAPVPFVFADVAKVPGGPPAYESVA